MHVLIINFTLDGLDEKGYRDVCADLAPAFAALPGLTAKIWLADPEKNTYGGVYLFEDREAMEGYLASDLLAGVGASPHFSGITMRDFAVYDDLTRVTQPGVEVFAATPA
jgi:putative monooxygenase ydhR